MIAADRERWRTAQQWLLRLLDLAPEERKAALAAADLDADLHARLQRLLAAADHPDPRLEPGPEGLALLNAIDAPGVLSGRQVGDWELLEEIGRGGMSVVYRARRRDQDYEQFAAVKLLGLASLGTGGALRFEQERRVLATLRHPHIASLVDGGVTADGTPFLAMQLVEGQHIDDWCSGRALALPERLRLLVQVCEAVAHAHRNLVVHRDIKPGNILVTDAGVPVLLDFGIAKLLDADAEATRTALRALTPAYAAPEQVEGGAITTATDVYGLGCVLRRLCAPFEPLSADLRNILARATHAEPERRYRDAQALADDLERWLHQRPVLASPDSAGYRLRMFLRRRRGVAIASALAVVALLAGIGATLWQAGRATEQARRAEASRDFLADLFVAADPERSGREEARLEHLVDRGLERIDASFADTPGLHAEMATLLGHLAMVSGQYPRAEELFRSALRRARDSRDGALEAEALYRLGMLANRRGDPAAAVGWMEQAQAALKADATGAQRLRERLLPELALALDNSGRREQAQALTRAALDQARASDGPVDADQRARVLITAAQYAPEPAQSLELLEEAMAWFDRGSPTPFERVVLEGNLGDVHFRSGDPARAAPHYQRAADASEQVWPGPASHKARLYNNLATNLSRAGRLTVAEEAFARADAIFRGIGDQDSPSFAALLNNRAVLLHELGRHREAAALRAEAVAIATRHFGDEDFRVGMLLNGLARSRAELGDARAEQDWQQSWAIARRDEDPERSVTRMVSGAKVALSLQRPELALQRLSQAEQLASASDTSTFKDPNWQVHVDATCGAVRARLGHAAEARACFDRGLARVQALGERAWSSAWQLHQAYGDLLRDASEPANAAGQYQQALDILQARGAGPDEPSHEALRARLESVGAPGAG